MTKEKTWRVPTTNETKKRWYILHVNEGLSYTDLGERFGRHPSTIQKAILAIKRSQKLKGV